MVSSFRVTCMLGRGVGKEWKKESSFFLLKFDWFCLLCASTFHLLVGSGSFGTPWPVKPLCWLNGFSSNKCIKVTFKKFRSCGG